jgi:hypothetical protein
VPHWCLYGPVPCAPLVSVWTCAMCPTGVCMGLCPTGVCMDLCLVPQWCLYGPMPCAPLVSVWTCVLCPTGVCMDLCLVPHWCLYGPALRDYIVSKFLTRSFSKISTLDLQILTTTNKCTVLILCISLLISCYVFRHQLPP